MSDKFEVGKRYTRSDIFHLLGIEGGGNWFTGYHQHSSGDWFVFSNIGTAGRTGHDYGDHWVREGLFWRGKTGSRLDQPSIKSMLSGRYPIHVFTRGHDRDPFDYQGQARAIRTENTVPVTVVWGFDSASSGIK